MPAWLGFLALHHTSYRRNPSPLPSPTHPSATPLFVERYKSRREVLSKWRVKSKFYRNEVAKKFNSIKQGNIIIIIILFIFIYLFFRLPLHVKIYREFIFSLPISSKDSIYLLFLYEIEFTKNKKRKKKRFDKNLYIIFH